MNLFIMMINVLILLGVSFLLGFYLGKGKIEIKKTYSKKEQELLKEEAEKQRKEFEEQIEEINVIARGGIL